MSDSTVDFPSYYYSANLSFERGLTPYDNSNWKLVRSLYTDGDVFAFLYPPTTLLFFRPFTLYDYQTALSVMDWLNSVLILVFLYVFFIKILELKPYYLILIPAIAYVYQFHPLGITINNSQVGIWLLVSICLAWWGTKDGWHPFWIALALVFGTALKIYPILVLFIYFFRRDYRTIVYFLLLLIAVCVIATVVLPQGIWQDWYESAASKGYAADVQGIKTATPANQSISGFLTRLFYGRNQRFDRLLRPPDWEGMAPYIATGIVMLVSLAATWLLSRRGDDPNNLNIAFCVWLLAIFLVAPFSWDHHLVHLLPVILIGVQLAWKRRKVFPLLFTIAIALFLAYDFPSNDPFFRRGIWTLLISSQLFAVGMLWIYFIYLSLLTAFSPNGFQFTSPPSTHTTTPPPPPPNSTT
ncbi:MAG: DUF2029 domain-containing protein [Chloroflexi bacterium]|nr:glycosyltransferase family 87 protein [Chloroflexota bacterium]MQC27186.1 DUF2029 domain-containing protein [Chloroflexota bacterium]